MSDGRKHPAQSNVAGPEGWPAGVRPISLDGLAHLGVGDDGRIYWDGRQVEVARTFSLTWWQKAGAIAVAASSVVAAAAAVASAIADWTK